MLAVVAVMIPTDFRACPSSTPRQVDGWDRFPDAAGDFGAGLGGAIKRRRDKKEAAEILAKLRDDLSALDGEIAGQERVLDQALRDIASGEADSRVPERFLAELMNASLSAKDSVDSAQSFIAKARAASPGNALLGQQLDLLSKDYSRRTELNTMRLNGVLSVWRVWAQGSSETRRAEESTDQSGSGPPSAASRD